MTASRDRGARVGRIEGESFKLIGPLPPDIQNYTSYGAALMNNAPSADAAKAFLTYLALPEAKQIFIAAGIE
jgi:molybdate transport system substrate-binding protein